MLRLAAISVLCFLAISSSAHTFAQEFSEDELQAIAREAYIFGFPIVANYRQMVAFAIDAQGEEFEAPLNTLKHREVVTGPTDDAVTTPNIDIAYSFAWLDLRVEPVVLSVPAMDEDRYYSIQLSDLYSYTFAYIGSRATGNEAGHYLIAGPNWQGERPDGIVAVIPCETEFALAVYRTQIRDRADLPQVEKLQSEYQVQTLSAFDGGPAPESTAAPVDELPPLPVNPAPMPEFFAELAPLLRFCPAQAPDQETLDRMGQIAIVAGEAFDIPDEFTDAQLEALERGMRDGDAAIRAAADSLKVAEVIGTREYLNGDYVKRAVAARRGRYSNAKEEALNPLYLTDGEGNPLDATSTKYVLTFGPDDLPPVNAFWSITLYDSATNTLVPNAAGRYRINSSMISQMARDADGKLSLLIQHEPPEDEREANWLPAPAGPFYMILRVYWPKPAAYDGSWTPPLVWPVAAQPTPTAPKPQGVEAAEEVKPPVAVDDAKPQMERPTVWGEPTEVQIAIYVIDVDEVNSADQSFAASVFYVARWKHPFMRHKGPGPLNRSLSEVWDPRLTIVGQQSQWKSYPDAVEIEPDGTVIYRQKIWGRFSQPLKLRDFPFDQQELKLHVVGAGQKENEVEITNLVMEQGASSGIASEFSLPDFDVVSWEAAPEPYYPGEEKVGTVGYSLTIKVARQPTYYVLKVIIPLCLIVIMSWLPRWLDPEQVGTNIGISTSAFLTLVAYLFAINILLPRVSYITRMDRFILLSTLMVFVGLIQTVGNSILIKREKQRWVERADAWSRVVYPVVLALILVFSFWF